MKKYFINLLMVFFCIMAFFIEANAENTIFVDSIEVDGTRITITGNLAYKEEGAFVIEDIEVEGKRVTVTGLLEGRSDVQVLCKVTTPSETIAYIDQKATNQDGSIEFSFKMPEWAKAGTYTVRCGTDAKNSPVVATFACELIESTPDIPEEPDIPDFPVILEEYSVSLDGRLITIDGKFNLANETATCIIRDFNEIVLLEENVPSDNNGNFSKEFTLPELSLNGTYTAELFNDSISEPTITQFQFISPGILDITCAEIDENGNVNVGGRSFIGDNLNFETISYKLYDSEDRILFEETNTTNSEQTFYASFPIPSGAGAGTYKLYFTNSVNTKTVYVEYEPNIVFEPVNIVKEQNPALYTALKKERKALDSDNDGIITVVELNLLTGSLDLSNKNISDINGLQSLTQIKSLHLGHNKISDFDVLGNLETLETLNLNNNDIEIINITPKNLKVLNLSNNKISTVEAIRRCENLEYFYADNNLISDLSVVQYTTELKALSLQNNMIFYSNGLEYTNKLQYINLSNNFINSLVSLEDHIGLRELRISNNKLNNIGTLPDKILHAVYIDGNSIPSTQAASIRAIIKKY